MKKGTKKLFPNSYDRFVSTMIEAAEQDELPIVLELNDIENVTLKDFQDLFTDFMKDTMLSIEGHMFACEDCGKLHMAIIVDYDKEEEPTLLQ